MATVSQIVELRGLCFHTLFGAAPPLKGSHSLCVTALGKNQESVEFYRSSMKDQIEML